VELAAQAGNDLVSKSRLGATIADARKRPAICRKLLNRLLYLVEIWMRFNRHDSGNISAASRRLFQTILSALANNWVAEHAAKYATR